MRLWAIVLTLLETIVGSSEATAITTYTDCRILSDRHGFG